MTRTRTLTLTRYALAFYLGATLALALPFASPFWPALAAGATALGWAVGR